MLVYELHLCLTHLGPKVRVQDETLEILQTRHLTNPTNSALGKRQVRGVIPLDRLAEVPPRDVKHQCLAA